MTQSAKKAIERPHATKKGREHCGGSVNGSSPESPQPHYFLDSSATHGVSHIAVVMSPGQMHVCCSVFWPHLALGKKASPEERLDVVNIAQYLCQCRQDLPSALRNVREKSGNSGTVLSKVTVDTRLSGLPWPLRCNFYDLWNGRPMQSFREKEMRYNTRVFRPGSRSVSKSLSFRRGLSTKMCQVDRGSTKVLQLSFSGSLKIDLVEWERTLIGCHIKVSRARKGPRRKAFIFGLSNSFLCYSQKVSQAANRTAIKGVLPFFTLLLD